MPFLEAIRQLRVEVGAKRAMLMHLTLVPYIATAGDAPEGWRSGMAVTNMSIQGS